MYKFSGINAIHIISLAFVLLAFGVLFLSLLASKYTTKPLLIITLLVSSFTAYFMNSYNVVIDTEMIRNTVQTNLNESMDLVSVKMFLYLFLLGILPSFLFLKQKYLINQSKKSCF